MGKPAREVAMELLLKNVTPEEVALTIGCDVSYVMGLQQDPEFNSTLVQKRTGHVIEKHDRDSAIDSLETIALGRLLETLPSETNTRVIIQAFNTLNGAKRRSANEGKINTGGTVVELHMPTFISNSRVEYQKDQQGQVVSIGGRRLETIDTKVLLEEATLMSPSIRKMVEDRESMEKLDIDDL